MENDSNKGEILKIKASKKAECTVGAVQSTRILSKNGVDMSLVHERLIGCSPDKVVDLLNKLTTGQRKLVGEMGFGGLFGLKFTKIDKEMAALALNAFDGKTSMYTVYQGEQFLVSKNDISDVFQLPSGPSAFPFLAMGRSKAATQEGVIDLKKKWCERYSINETKMGIPVWRVQSELEGMIKKDDCGDDFMRVFVIFVCTVFLAPTSNNRVDYTLLNAIEDVSKIHTYDWCTYVCESLRGSRQKDVMPKYITGCLPVLFLVYFHRYSLLGVDCSPVLPLIQHWDEENLNKRVQHEVRINCLGRAPKSKVLYPISGQEFVSAGLRIKDKDDEQPKRYIQLELPEWVKDDEQLKAIALDEAELICLKKQRLTEVFFASYLELSTELKAVVSAKAAACNAFEAATRSDSTQSQRFWASTALHEWADEVDRIALELKIAANNVPSFEGLSQVQLSPLHANPTPPHVSPTHADPVIHETADLNVDATVISVVEDIYRDHRMEAERRGNLNIKIPLIKRKRTEVNEREEPGMEEDVERDVERVVERESVERDDHTAGPETTSQLLFHRFLFHSTNRLTCMDVVPEDLGCTIECGEANADEVVVSEFLLKNKNIFDPMLSLRKDVIDFCFLFDYPSTMENALVKYTDRVAFDKMHVETLCNTEYIDAQIVDAWCYLLNFLSVSGRGEVKTTRSFFDLSCATLVQKSMNLKAEDRNGQIQMDIFGALDNWLEESNGTCNLNADLIFVPLIDHDGGHYTAICINFLEKRVDYLDNRKFYAKSAFVRAAKHCAYHMGCFMSKKGIEKGLDLLAFPVVNIAFSWQDTYSDGDCGVFLLLHLMFYRGEIFDCMLGDADQRILYRGEICAILALADINESRDELVKAAADLKAKPKAALLPVLLKQREEARLLKDKERLEGRELATKNFLAEGLDAYFDAQKSITEDDMLKLGYVEELPLSVQHPNPKKRKTMVKKKRASLSPLQTLAKVAATPSMVRPVNMDPHSPASILGSHHPPNGFDPLGCSIECGPIEAKALMISSLIRMKRTIFELVKSLRMEVADYIFLDDHTYDANTWVFRNKKFRSISKKELYTLHPEEYMDEGVVDVWAFMLNELEHIFRGVGDTYMVFFGSGHFHLMDKIVDEVDQYELQHIYDNIFNVWDTLLRKAIHRIDLDEADYLFVPVLMSGTHYFCVCIDFCKKRVIILDNIPYKDDAEFKMSPVCRFAKIVVDCMADYLRRHFPGSPPISSFKITAEKFSWQNKENTDEESGIFLLAHMLGYQGKPFKNETLQTKQGRRIMAVEAAAAIVLSDFNEERDIIVKFVNQFKLEKADVWKQVDYKRKLINMARKKGFNIAPEKLDTELPLLRLEGIGRGRGRGRGKKAR